MTTLDEVLQIQSTAHILMAPTQKGIQEDVATTASTLSIALKNNTTSSNVNAYITGLAINNNNAVWLLESDGQTSYYPSSPSSTGAALQANCSIALGAPGNTVTVTIPQIAGGRIWFCQDDTLTFLLNPGSSGAALVEPSVTNTSDPNYNKYWDFCEFTYNSVELYANISYVDFVCLPISLDLEDTSGNHQTVLGIPSTGLDTVCTNLQAQDAEDGAGWSQLIIPDSSGANLRALSPNSGIALISGLFSGYYDSYVSQVWSMYSSATLTVDTQAQWGTVTAMVTGGDLTFSGVGAFTQPATADIFSCATGPFGSYSTNTAEMGDLTARIAAAFNRSTLLIDSSQPDGENPADYYQNSITNHYARIVHAANLDGLGYAFPYDDVVPTGGADQSGAVESSIPQLYTVTVGAASSNSTVDTRAMTRPGRQLVAGRAGAPRRVRRGLEEETNWLSADEEKAQLQMLDLEAGNGGGNLATALHRPPSRPSVLARALSSLVPAGLSLPGGHHLERLVGWLEDSPAYRRVRPAFEVLARLLLAFMSLSLRAVISRAAMVLFFLVFYFFAGPLARSADPAGSPAGTAVATVAAAASATATALPTSEVLVDSVDVAALGGLMAQ